MQVPLQIIFRGIPPSAAVERRARSLAAGLEQICDEIISCRVTIEFLHKHHHHGGLYRVRIDLTIPGAELVASRTPEENHAHEDVYVALRDAYDALRRQLDEHLDKRRGAVKRHVPPPHGRIVELQADHGRIETPDQRIVYFHRNSVLDADFAQLKLGDEVRFAEDAGESGPQASTVHVIGKHHLAG